jgi:hypothetical protein
VPWKKKKNMGAFAQTSMHINICADYCSKEIIFHASLEKDMFHYFDIGILTKQRKSDRYDNLTNCEQQISKLLTNELPACFRNNTIKHITWATDKKKKKLKWQLILSQVLSRNMRTDGTQMHLFSGVSLFPHIQATELMSALDTQYQYVFNINDL